MKKDTEHAAPLDIDDISINPSNNTPFDAVLTKRRGLLKGSLGLALGGFVGHSAVAAPQAPFTKPSSSTSALNFSSVAVQQAADFDRVEVAKGYTAQPFFSWGDAVMPGASAWREDASNSWQEQTLQAGQNHDGMAYFPLQPGTDSENSHGLLVINHEYINWSLHPKGPTTMKGAQGRMLRPKDEVLKEQAAHGVSVIEVKKDETEQWQRVNPSRLNRRITGNTPMAITGPAAGTDIMKTQGDPTGTRVLGTLNNCSMGQTPWGTYLICEENWHNYFVNRDVKDWSNRRSHSRYNISHEANSRYYQWESTDPRFDATPNPKQPQGGFVNEPHRFGWVVEFNPLDPKSTPKKRTALGRFARECATVSVDDDGRIAIYSGDDTGGEYVYKFVPKGLFKKGQTKADNNLLDEGTLYVAIFNDDGTGNWLPLVWGVGGLTARNGFVNQTDVVVNARAAADIVGATPMDRPEWVAIDPNTRDVYVTLTNNGARGIAPDQPLNAANPRQGNKHGQIVRWQEKGASSAAVEFVWDVFLLAGNDKSADVPENEKGNIKGDLFSCPDGLWFDRGGRLWIETDYYDNSPAYKHVGCNQLLCADIHSREVRRFLVGPRGCEITGLTSTPDGKTLWLNIQHPGLSYPASDGKTRARSTTVMVTKDDGGVIGG